MTASALPFLGCQRQRRKIIGEALNVTATLLHYAQDDLPFGDVGPSGIGAYHGNEGLKALSHVKGIFTQARWNLPSLMRASFGP